MGYKQYHTPCLRRIADLPQGTFFSYNHTLHMVARVKTEHDPIIYVVDLEHGTIDSYPDGTIVSVIYDGTLRISTNAPGEIDNKTGFERF